MATKFELSGLGALAQADVNFVIVWCSFNEEMNSVAFIFTQAPHGNSAGREGLDALLATSALTENIGVFFFLLMACSNY